MSHPLLQFFSWEHLPPKLQGVSKRFADVAHAVDGMSAAQMEVERDLLRRWQAKSIFSRLRFEVDSNTPANTEATWAVTKVGESADAFVLGDLDTMFRKLLEAKDCAVRALLFKHPEPQRAQP